MALTASASGSTLVFVPQLDPSSGTTNYSWFSAGNWFMPDGSQAFRVPQASDSAIITSLADAGTTGVRVQNLVLTNNAVASNGTFSVQNLQMLSASSFQDATNFILTSLNVGGTNCTLSGTFMDVLSSATFAPIAPATASTLTLAQGSVLQDSGTVMLAGGSQIIAGSLPQSTLIIEPGAVLSSTNLTYIEGSAAGALTVDNSGLIRADGGTLRFDNGIAWQCSAGTGEFRAAATNSLILFASGFHADGGATSLFTGLGTNRWLSDGTIDGTAQVGGIDPNTSAFSTGNLEILASYSGLGNVHVLGDPVQTAVLNWSNGTLSLAAINVDANATMLISGGAGTSRQLSGCALNNSGICSVLSGDLALAQGSVLQNSGSLFLNDGSQITSGSLPQSSVIIKPGAVLSSTNLTYIEGSATNHLIVDNSGLIRVDGGTLQFDNGIDWQCSAGTGEFRAAATNSLILFASGFHADGGTTSLFTGLGTNRWLSGGTIDGTGTAQVGGIDPNTSAFSTGNLEILASYSGLGNVHVLGDPAQTAVLNWSNGTLSLAAINVDANATMLISGGAGTSRQLSGCALTNSGLCSVSSGDLTLAQGSSINNLAGGTNVLMADGTFYGSPLPLGGAVNNAGIFRKSSPGLTQFGTVSTSQGPDFNNAGLVDVVSGQLNLMGGNSSGQFQTEAGAVLWFWGGTHTLSTGASFTGPGSVRLYQGASVPQWLVNGSVSATELELGTNGTIGGIGALGIASALFWTNGIIQGSGSLSISTGATLNIGGSAGKTLSQRTINNQGNILLHDQATVNCGAGATLNNLAGGTLDIQTDAALTFSNASPMLVINNAGSFVKSAGTQTSLIAANLNNSGTIEVKAGTLQFQGSWSQTAGSTTVDAGTVLGGTLLSIGGGTLAGTGTIQAAVVNGGVTSPGGSPGTLSLGPGQNYQQAASGTLRIELGGRTQYDQLVVGGNASLAGTLELPLINGFVPQAGDQFQILTCASQTGRFSQINPPAVSGAVWVAHSNGTNVSVVLANPVNIAKPVLSGGMFNLSFNTTARLTYVVQKSDSLNPSNWQTLEEIAGDGGTKTLSDPATKPQSFYRILIQ
jgi:hypothetical protein